MPGGSGPVEIALLPRLPDEGFRAFVRFPRGWSRSEVGHYAVPEEFLVLEGELGLNGRTWKAAGYAWIRAWRLRRDLHSASGCLVFAWFAGTPRWLPGEPAHAASAPDVSFGHWREAPAGRLYEGPEHRTWIDGRRLARLAPRDALRETLDLTDFTWRCAAVE